MVSTTTVVKEVTKARCKKFNALRRSSTRSNSILMNLRNEEFLLKHGPRRKEVDLVNRITFVRTLTFIRRRRYQEQEFIPLRTLATWKRRSLASSMNVTTKTARVSTGEDQHSKKT